MNQEQAKKLEGVSGSAESIKEVKSKLVRDYVDSQRVKHDRNQRYSASSSVVEDGLVVFSVLDDQKLYGSSAIELEFQTRQLDPYSWYKQQLAASAQRVSRGEISESA